MALSFLQYGVTPSKRNTKRRVKPTLITWKELPSYLRTSIEANTDRLIRQSQWAENYTDGEYPMECRHIFGNANIPIGYHGGISPKHLVKSVPCKNVKQGKETLEEIVQAIESDIDTQRVVASFLNGRKGFDSSTIPSNLIGGQLAKTS